MIYAKQCGGVDLAFGGLRCSEAVGIESTVAAIEGGKLKLPRPGMISFEDLEQQVLEGSHAGQSGRVCGAAVLRSA